MDSRARALVPRDGNPTIGCKINLRARGLLQYLAHRLVALIWFDIAKGNITTRNVSEGRKIPR
jgi:hypothetical protein